MTVRIVYIHQYFRTPTMGGGTRSYEFAKRLVGRGHQVYVLTGDHSSRKGLEHERITVESGIVVHWLAVPYDNSMSYGRRIWAFLKFVRRAAAVAARLECDLVFATSTPLTVVIPGVFAALRRRVPMVMEVRDLWPELPIAVGALRSPVVQRTAWQLEAWAYRRSAHVIALSPGMASNIQERFPRVAVTVVPNCADLDVFARADEAGKELRATTPWLGRRPLILYAGTISLANGVDYLVRMAQVLADTSPEIRIAIVGTGGLYEDVRDLARRHGVLDRNLFMPGAMSKTAVVAYFGACDLALSTLIDLPALRASSPNKVFDAFAAGRPAGVNYGGWIAEIIAESGAGLVLPADDPCGGAHAAASFLGDEDRLMKARSAARRLARERFDRDIQFGVFERVLTAVAGRRYTGADTSVRTPSAR